MSQFLAGLSSLTFANGPSIKLCSIAFLDCGLFPARAVTGLVLYLTHLFMSSNITPSVKVFLDPYSQKKKSLSYAPSKQFIRQERGPGTPLPLSTQPF